MNGGTVTAVSTISETWIYGIVIAIVIICVIIRGCKKGWKQLVEVDQAGELTRFVVSTVTAVTSALIVISIFNEDVMKALPNMKLCLTISAVNLFYFGVTGVLKFCGFVEDKKDIK